MQLQTRQWLASQSLTFPGSKSVFTSHPSRVYVSPPWRRSTTVGGPSSLPPCLAVLWRRWWSGRASSSRTGNCPGCKFSFPSMFWLWAGLRQRASSGKIHLTEPITCPYLSTVGEVLESRKGSYVLYVIVYVFIACTVCINKCVWSPVSLYFKKALAVYSTHNRQQNKHCLIWYFKICVSITA